MTDIKKGDRVRVVIEGEVTEVTDRDIHLGRESRSAIFAKDPVEYEVTVEKIEPPVEVFAPGDVVRSRDGRVLIALDLEGYTYLRCGSEPGKRFAYSHGYPAGEFTSERYERVSLDSPTR